jgi:hypothetical protein
MNNENNRTRISRRFLGFLQLFIAIGAIGGGMGFIFTPDGSALKVPLDMLANTPFKDFLIPGIVLFTVNGVGNLIAGILTWKKNRLYPLAAILLGLFMLGWIIVQVYWFKDIHWLHTLYFSLGAIEFTLGIITFRLKT